MRSDREEIPEGYTKEDADKAEIDEANLLKTRSMQRGVGALAAPTDCMFYWPAFGIQVCGEIRVKYDSLGGSSSFLLFPTANDVANPDNYGRRQTFANGPIYWSPATGAHPVVNSFLNRWGVHQYEAGWLKYPTTDEILLPDGGRRQEFQTGAIYVAFQNAIGSAIANGPIRDKWNSVGAQAGPLGYVSSDEFGVNKNNGRYNNFVNGTITWSQPTGARLLFGAIRDRWFQFGREDGAMGFPLSDEETLADGGHLARFEDGSSIYWSLLTGAWRVPLAVLQIWKGKGYESGPLGYPVAAVSNDSQLFQNGQVFKASENEAYVGVYQPQPSTAATISGQVNPAESGLNARQSYDSDTVEAWTANKLYAYDYMPVRTGFYNGDADLGFGYDKAYHKHNLTNVGTIIFALESPYAKARTDGDPGQVFYADAQKLGPVNMMGDRPILDEQEVNAVYDDRDFPTYYGLPAGSPLGLVTAYCENDNQEQDCENWLTNVTREGRN